MQLASLINSTLPQRADEIAGALRAWSKGQMLDATVLRTGNGQALLQVNGQHVLAQTRMPLTVGQTLRLQVDKAGTQPQLRVLDGPPNGPAHASTTAPDGPRQGAGNGAARGDLLQVLAQRMAPAPTAAGARGAGAPVPSAMNEALAVAVLRSALPQRQSLPHSMKALERFVATPRPSLAHPALEQARAMASDLLQGLPRPEDAGDAHRLRAMVQRSGLFHEAELAQQQKELRELAGDPARATARQHVLNPPAADMKARLMAVAESLSTAMRGAAEADHPGEQAAAALRGAVSNIEANQVVSVRGSEHAAGQNNAQGAVWRVDLPFADAHGHQALQLRIDRESRGRADDVAQASWIAQVTIQPPGRAPVHARIALNRDTVYTTFTTDDQPLCARIAAGEAQLRELLDAVDLALGGMSCQQAEVREANDEFPHAALVSEHV